MQRLVFFSLFLMPSIMIAQVVDIPDANFLAALIEDDVDVNGDGLIQVSEAEVVDSLKIIGGQIYSLQGIESFVSLKYFECRNNNLTDIDVSHNVNIQSLNLSGNELNAIDVSQNILVTTLNVGDNNLSALDVSHNALLRELIFKRNHISTLDLSAISEIEILDGSYNLLDSIGIGNLIALSYLDLISNELETIDISNNTQLQSLYITGNNIQNIDLVNNGLLKHFLCNENELNDLNLSNNTLLENLGIRNNSISELDLINLVYLRVLDCSGNQISAVDVSNNLALEHLSCGKNSISCLDVSNNPLLISLYCFENNLSFLDVSYNSELNYFNCNENTIMYLNIQNGSAFTCIDGWFCGAAFNPIQYICADDVDSLWLSSYLGPDLLETIELNTYCDESMEKGLNLLSGKTQYDSDGNCNENSQTINDIPFLIQDTVRTYKYLPSYDSENTYSIYFTYGPQNIKYCLDSEYLNVSVDSLELDLSIQADTIIHDICVSPKGDVFTDLSIDLIPTEDANAGFSTEYKIVINNLGNTFSSGEVTLSFPQDSVVITESSDAYSVDGNVISWIYTDLSISSQKTIYVTLRFNSPIDNPPLSGGEMLKLSAKVFPEITDAFFDDNVVSILQELNNTYDSNHKRCLQGDFLYEENVGRYLYYWIQFQNNSDEIVQDITVLDTLDNSVLDINSIKYIDSSHPVNLNQNEDVLKFVFKDIDLGYNYGSNEGYVLFKIKTLEELVAGDSIVNSASIYLDLNDPIITNPAITYIVSDNDQDGFNNLEDCDDSNPAINPEAIDIPGNGIDEDCDGMDAVSSVSDLKELGISVYPNPVKDVLHIETTNLESLTIAIDNINGQNILRKLINEGSTSIDMSKLSSGVYSLRIDNRDKSVSTLLIVD